MSGSGLNMSRRIRRTPYTDSVEKYGVRGFSVVNHMLLPKAYQRTVEEDYWHLREHVQLWDVSCQRQVEIKGPDAEVLVQWMTPRSITKAKIGQCLYVPLVDDRGGMINDPVLLKLAEDHFWLSIADSDILLWARGLALGRGLNVIVEEPDVSPLAVQGPKAIDLMSEVFGTALAELGFFKFLWVEFQGVPQLVARSGYSKQGGFEIYLRGSEYGSALWEALWEAGQKYEITPGCPNLIERIEGGLLSYGNDFTRENSPFECGMDALCQLDPDNPCIGYDALLRMQQKGVSQLIRGVSFEGPPAPVCGKPWPVMIGERQVGQITSGIYSPRLQRNIGLSMIQISCSELGQAVTVLTDDGLSRSGELRGLPFNI